VEFARCLTLDQLLGFVHNVSAEQGIVVSWNGFKSVEQEQGKTLL
jgi:hypothetical protein